MSLLTAPANSFNVESLKGQAVTKQLKEVVDRVKENVAQRIFNSCLQGILPDEEELLSNAERIHVSLQCIVRGNDDMACLQLKRCIMAMQKHSLPPICTHNMIKGDDQVLEALRRTNLINNRGDRVKVVFHPGTHLSYCLVKEKTRRQKCKCSISTYH